MQEKILGELIFARIHAGLVFALARIQENIFEEVFPEYFAKFLGEFTRCEYMPRLYSHPREYRKIFLANYLCIGFVPGGTLGPPYRNMLGNSSQLVLLSKQQKITRNIEFRDIHNSGIQSAWPKLLTGLSLATEKLTRTFFVFRINVPKLTLTLTLFTFVRINFALVQALMSDEIGSPKTYTYTSESVSN